VLVQSPTVQSPKSGLRASDLRPWTLDFGPWTPACPVPTCDRRWVTNFVGHLQRGSFFVPAGAIHARKTARAEIRSLHSATKMRFVQDQFLRNPGSDARGVGSDWAGVSILNLSPAKGRQRIAQGFQPWVTRAFLVAPLGLRKENETHPHPRPLSRKGRGEKRKHGRFGIPGLRCAPTWARRSQPVGPQD
jgi:hypothetical protein